MPVCFQLYPLGESEPAPLAAIDDELRAHLGQPPHPTDYLYSWFDIVGFRLAMGKSWDEIRADLEEYVDSWDLREDEDYLGLLAIVSYLKSHYTTRAWREQKR